MNILLIHPQNRIHRYTTGIYGRLLRYAPITMPTLAALVPEELNAKITYIDEMIEDVDFNINADIVGITCISGTARRAYEIADRFRKRGIKVVLGGVHPTLMPEEAYTHADSVVRGYAEVTWPKLLLDFQKGKLKKEYFDFDIEPDKIVKPLRSLIKTKYYIAPNTIEFSRGCNNKCEYCISHDFNNNIIVKETESVLNEIESIPSKIITFLDPNIIADVELAYQFFSQLKRCRKYWAGSVTVEIMKHPELLELMIESGCKALLVGFESLNQNTLDTTEKSFNKVGEYISLIKLLHNKGIMIEGCFMLGFDNDNINTYQEIAEFVCRSHIDLVHYTIYTPFPGSALFERMEAEDRILTRDWSLYNGQNVVYKPALISAEELQKSVHRLWKLTYRYSSIFKRLMCRPWYLKPLVFFSNLNLKNFIKRRIPD